MELLEERAALGAVETEDAAGDALADVEDLASGLRMAHQHRVHGLGDGGPFDATFLVPAPFRLVSLMQLVLVRRRAGMHVLGHTVLRMQTPQADDEAGKLASAAY